jgi:hypothetical protein
MCSQFLTSCSNSPGIFAGMSKSQVATNVALDFRYAFGRKWSKHNFPYWFRGGDFGLGKITHGRD